jgi:hypothetical protein
MSVAWQINDAGDGPMNDQASESRWQQVFSFCKRVTLIVAIDVGLSLAMWLIISVFDGSFGSPAGALFLGAIFLFVLAMLPFFYDIILFLILPLRAWLGKTAARVLVKQDRSRSEMGIMLTFLLFVAGVVVLILSFLAERMWGIYLSPG